MFPHKFWAHKASHQVCLIILCCISYYFLHCNNIFYVNGDNDHNNNNIQRYSGILRNFFRGEGLCLNFYFWGRGCSANSVEDKGQRGWRSGGGSASQGFHPICKLVKPVFWEGCYGCIFHGIVKTPEFRGGLKPPPRYATVEIHIHTVACCRCRTFSEILVEFFSWRALCEGIAYELPFSTEYTWQIFLGMGKYI
jgi:hypothetical protein